MLKHIGILIALFVIATGPNSGLAATRASNYVSANTYNNLYPYMNNTMRTQLNPGTSPSQSNAPINTLVRTRAATNTATRNVVARTPTTSASGVRAATTGTSARTGGVATSSTRRVTQRPGTTTARAATGTASMARSGGNTTQSRRVVARAATGTTGMSARARTNRNDTESTVVRNGTGDIDRYGVPDNAVSSTRCLADYTKCMNDYCEREDTEYNRCYCSAKLAQIDAQYKPEIDRLIKEILTVKNNNQWTDAEMNEYWMEMVGQYTGENSWENLDAALDIDWSTTASNVRGQQAFAMGHEYCVRHLENCAWMQNNLRDAYRSEISRDCATYESSLRRLQNAAESMLGTYE